MGTRESAGVGLMIGVIVSGWMIMKLPTISETTDSGIRLVEWENMNAVIFDNLITDNTYGVRAEGIFEEKQAV